MATFIGDIVAGVRSAIEPLENAFANETALKEFFAEFGWDVSVSPSSVGVIRAGFALDALFDAAEAIWDQLEEGTGDPARIAVALKDAVGQIIDAIKLLSSSPPNGLPFPLNQPAFWSEVPPALGDFLLLRLMQAQQPELYGTMRLLGIAEISDQTPVGTGRVPYRRREIRWDRIPRLVSDPAGLLQDVYKWDKPQPFEHAKLFAALEDFFHGLRVAARKQGVRASLAQRYYDPANPALASVRELAVPLFSADNADRTAYAEVGLTLLPIPPAGAPLGAPVGVGLSPLVTGTVGAGDSSAPYTLALKGGFQIESSMGAAIRPSGVTFFLDPGATMLDAAILFTARPDTPWILLGDPGSSRLEVGGFEAGVALRGQAASPEVTARVGTGSGANPPKLAVVIQTSDADSFLGSIVGSNPIRLEVGGAVLWSSRTGFHMEGGGGFEIAIPLHWNLGVAEIDTLSLALRGSSAGLTLDAGISGKAMLGPLQVVVENFGMRATLKFASPDGKLGDLDVGIGFKPPRGVGLSIDTGVVKGGGYLSFDPDRGEYAGAMELAFANFLTLKAIGLVTTRQPDGSGGFSLLVIITAEFGQGIQLGFGFTLLGVGGLLGLHRTMRLDLLAQGARSGSLSSIMFPRDVVANAQRILSDLRAFFPQRQGTFLIGPMAKLGWGTPTLVTVSIGVIIEIPGNIAIVGVLRVALPDERAAVLVLQVSFIGAIEFDKKRVWFFASLFDSRVLFITIEGEMGVLVAWGNQPNFVVSVGGFHPRFSPPPLPFPTPRRVAVQLINTSAAKVRIEGYFAVTSNTAQFGARAELFFGMRALNVSGHIGFDALFQFSPFYFIIDISASFSAKVFGAGLFSVSIQMSLEGPTPWRARGTGSIKLLFIRVSANFDITWGESRNTVLPPISVVPLLTAELEKAENWRAEFPAGNRELVSLRTLAPTEAALVLHPVGTLRVSQRAVPLELTMDKVGNQRPSDARRVSLSVVTGGLAKRADVMEQFAPAQFQDMSNDQKLSRPAYGAQKGGVELAVTGRQIESSRAVRRTVRYEQSVTDTNYRRRSVRFAGFGGTLFHFFARGGAIAQNELSAAVRGRLQPFADRVAVSDDGFTVAFQHDNRAFAAEAASFASEASAREYLSRRVAADPNLADALHVIPDFERAA